VEEREERRDEERSVHRDLAARMKKEDETRTMVRRRSSFWRLKLMFLMTMAVLREVETREGQGKESQR